MASYLLSWIYWTPTESTQPNIQPDIQPTNQPDAQPDIAQDISLEENTYVILEDDKMKKPSLAREYPFMNSKNEPYIAPSAMPKSMIALTQSELVRIITNLRHTIPQKYEPVPTEFERELQQKTKCKLE